MRARLYTVDLNNAGRRLETVLCALLPEVARGRLMKWLRCGKVRVNGTRAKPHVRLVVGDAISLPFVMPAGDGSEQAPSAPRRRLPPLDIAYEDDDVIVADKPAGLASHPGIGHHEDSLSARLVAYLGAEEAGVGLRPGLAQRLDRGVTGLVPCGKHAAALRELGQQHLFKSYVACVYGRIDADAGRVTEPLLSTDEPRGNRPKVVVDYALGKAAQTDFIVLARRNKVTFVRLLLQTGRTHQIRAHMRALGHPLVGDERYADDADNEHMRATYGIDRPMLHAARLRFVQPMTGQQLVTQSPLPRDFVEMLRRR